MGIRAEWTDSSHQIHQFSIEVPWTLLELRMVTDQAFSEIRNEAHPVATIVDVSRIKKLPQGDFLGHLQYTDSQMPSNVYVSVVVGAPYIITAFMNVLMRLRPNAKRSALFSRTLEEAHTLIQQRLEQVNQETSGKR